jgi:hypothetical protein
MPHDTLTWPEPTTRPLGTPSDRTIRWLGLPTQPPPTTDVPSGRKPVDLDKVPAYLRDTGRFRR